MIGLLASVPASVPVQPGREAAQDLLLDELAKQEYQEARPGLISRCLDWLFDQFNRIDVSGGGSARPWVTAAVLIVVLLVLGLALWLAGGLRRTARGEKQVVLDDGSLTTAAQQRADAERAAAAGEWEVAVVARFRAVALSLEERAVIAALPGRTAHEVAVTGGESLPDLARDLVAAADVFDRVRYGHRPAGEAEYAAVRDLDDRVGRARVGVGGSAVAGGFEVPV
ncbi:DUF4129 domain-containing protein [Spongisporangium articulatum]|uniref:DUF4129 domain-containing protein n=1 Tax=Spongisporangium articulatum TaxID=3362603 RepID=A0ABW8AJV6_9ACTN